MWRMGGTPQNSRHKNKVSVAHWPMHHRKSYTEYFSETQKNGGQI
jgi:hypothetical protein